MKTTDLVDNQYRRTDIPSFGPGDEVKVHVRVVESGKERIQVFQGNVIAIQGSGIGESYTVRKLSYGVGVERTFPMHSPIVAKLEVLKKGDVRRAKLYYLRDRVGKRSSLREKLGDASAPAMQKGEALAPEAPAVESAPVASEETPAAAGTEQGEA